MLRCVALLACLDGGGAHRPDEFNRVMELRMMQDGHFVIGPSEAANPVAAAVAVNRSRRISLQVTPGADDDVVPVLLERPPLLQEAEHRTKIHARAALLQVAQTMSADELAEAERILEIALQSPTDEKVPDQMVTSKPVQWTMKAWKAYKKAQEMLAPFRGTAGNAIATFAALGLGADSCILKIAFIMYTHQGEDDYPYLPNGCGMGFNYQGAGGAATTRLSGLLIVALAWAAGRAT